MERLGNAAHWRVSVVRDRIIFLHYVLIIIISHHPPGRLPLVRPRPRGPWAHVVTAFHHQSLSQCLYFISHLPAPCVAQTEVMLRPFNKVRSTKSTLGSTGWHPAIAGCNIEELEAACAAV